MISVITTGPDRSIAWAPSARICGSRVCTMKNENKLAPKMITNSMPEVTTVFSIACNSAAKAQPPAEHAEQHGA